MRPLFISILVVLFFQGVAQGNKTRYSGYAGIGLLGGRSDAAFHAHTIHGIEFKKFYLGAGAGFDGYKYNSIPLFASGRTYFGSRKNVFAFGNIGYHFPLNQDPATEIFYTDDYSYKGGLYSDAGMGFRTSISKKMQFSMRGGFSYKEMSVNAYYTAPCLVPPCPQQTEQYSYQLGRIMLSAGIEF